MVLMWGGTYRVNFSTQFYRSKLMKPIVFLESDSIAQLEDSMQIYIDGMSINERKHVRKFSESAHSTLDDVVCPWKPHEKTFIRANVRILQNSVSMDELVMRSNAPRQIDWKFIKVKSGFENDYPHTHNDVIVLSESYIQHAQLEPVYDFIETLVHERIHILQRLYPNTFAKLYERHTRWRRTHANVDVILPRHIRTRTRANPDSPQLGSWYYITPHSYDLVIPLVVYDEKKKQNMSTVTLQCFDLNSQKIITRIPHWEYPHSVSYADPNEIWAVNEARRIVLILKNII